MVRKGMWSRLIVGRVIAGLVGVLLYCSSAYALKVPDPMDQAILVKSTLMTFNDANVTGNYEVLYLRMSKIFQGQFTVAKLADVFKPFREQHIDIGMVVGMDINYSKAANIDDDGVLYLTGYFDTKPKNVDFVLKFVQSDGEWKPFGVNVSTK